MTHLLQRETYEWSNIWWSHADDKSLLRVLLIGDSISVGYSPKVTRELEGTFHVDRLANSKAVNDPAHLKETVYMLGEYPYAAVHFNNGLHGCHLPDDDYADHLEKYVLLLKKHAPNVPLVWAASTPVTVNGDVQTLDPKTNAQVLARNERAATIMKKYNIPVNDLYTLVIGQPDLRSTDGYHYNEQGYDQMGRAVANAIRQATQNSSR